MRYNEIILEAREAPLYHFTTEKNMFAIIESDVLQAGGPRVVRGELSKGQTIYFTRSYSRQFIPGNPFSGSWGFRIDQDVLRKRFGKLLTPGGQTRWTEKQRQAWLSDPDNAYKLKFARSLTTGGAQVSDIVSGNIARSARWEDEEHLKINQLDNFHTYVTGLVYAGGDKFERGEQETKFNKRSSDPKANLKKLAELFLLHWQKSPTLRDKLFKWLQTYNIPVVYRMIDYTVTEIIQAMNSVAAEQEAEEKRAEREDKTMYIVIRNDAGGGIAVNAKDPQHAAQKALRHNPEHFPNGVLGVSAGNQTWMFKEPLRDPNLTPQI